MHFFITAIPGKMYAFSEKHPRLTVLFISIGVIFFCAFLSSTSYYRSPKLEISLELIEQPYGDKFYYSPYSSRVFPAHRTMPLDYSPYYYLVTIRNSGGSCSGKLEFDYSDNTYSETLSFSIKRNHTFQTVIPTSHMIQDMKVKELPHHAYRILTPRLQGQISSCICIGILGEYSEQFIDMVFENYPYNKKNTNYPLEAISLNADNMKEYLPSLTFLMIDNYDTASLPEDIRTDIVNWTYNGGLLILGGGSTAHKNISGFKDDFLPYTYEINLYEKNPGQIFSWNYPYPNYPSSLPEAWWLRHFGYYRETGLILGCKAGACEILYYSPYEIRDCLNSSNLNSQKNKQIFCDILYEMMDELYYLYNRNGNGPDYTFL